VIRLLARWRVFLGFVFAAIVLWLATPGPRTFAAGAAIAILGEALRLWAAGHLEKSKEVTQSGPYRYTRHPLYLGSSLIGDAYDAYAEKRAARVERSFSWARALRNREHHAILGLIAGLALLAVKLNR
jgi:protein-S-isoprenylcysteine O-methyltransferase Ste14